MNPWVVLALLLIPLVLSGLSLSISIMMMVKVRKLIVVIRKTMGVEE